MGKIHTIPHFMFFSLQKIYFHVNFHKNRPKINFNEFKVVFHLDPKKTILAKNQAINEFNSLE